MKKKANKLRIIACTLAHPKFTRKVGRFCEWYKTEGPCRFSGITSFIDSKLNENEPKRLVLPYTDEGYRSNPILDRYPNPIIKPDQNFVRVTIREEKLWGTYYSEWEFVLTPEKLDEIESNTKDGGHIQLYNIAFDQQLQWDPNLKISTSNGIKSGLKFQTKKNSLLALGFIHNHRSMTLAEYEAITGKDPVMLHARQTYYDPISHDGFLRQGISFDTFCGRIKNCYVRA